MFLTLHSNQLQNGPIPGNLVRQDDIGSYPGIKVLVVLFFPTTPICAFPMFPCLCRVTLLVFEAILCLLYSCFLCRRFFLLLSCCFLSLWANFLQFSGPRCPLADVLSLFFGASFSTQQESLRRTTPSVHLFL